MSRKDFIYSNNNDFLSSSTRKGSFNDNKFDPSSTFSASYRNNQLTESDSFLRSTMGSNKNKINKDTFQKYQDKKSQNMLRNTTGNLAQLLKKLDFGDEPENKKEPKKYEYESKEGNFKKEKQPYDYQNSKYSSKNDYLSRVDEKLNSTTSETSSKYDEILNRLNKKKQVVDDLKKWKAERQNRSSKTNSLSNLLSTVNYTGTTSSKQISYKNPEDNLYSSYKKDYDVSETDGKYGNYEKKTYDFSKKNKVQSQFYTPKTTKNEYQKKYEDILNKKQKYDTPEYKTSSDFLKKYETPDSSKQSVNQFLAKYDKPLSTNNIDTNFSKNSSKSPNNGTNQFLTKYDKPLSTNNIDTNFSKDSSKKQVTKKLYQNSGISSIKNIEKNPKMSNCVNSFGQKVSINDFALGKLLGEGKFGNVYQALHKQTKSLFALKKVPKSIIKSHYMIDQFILEIKIQSFLNQQNLLSLYGFFDDAENIYLIIEYMEEGTLFSLFKKKKILSQEETAVKVKEISLGIINMHENGLAHRDLKPQNVVISHGVCKLCDFGWATICDQRRKTYCGTFDYAAPQILEGNQYDQSVDLWCLGVLTYELMVGKAPFYHIKKQQTKKRILNVQTGVITYPQKMSKEAVHFIQHLLKKDPEERLKIQDILKHQFILKYTT